MKTRKITYDLGRTTYGPQAGCYIVTIGRKTNAVGTVYLIHSARVMKSKTYGRWMLEVVPQPGLRELTEVGEGKVFVRGEQAFVMVWYSRDKKK